LTFNPNFEEFGCPPEVTLRGKIPTLEQVLLDAKQSGLHVKIELKGDGTVKPTLDLVERLEMTHQCSYSSFDLDRLKELRELRHDRIQYPTGALFADLPTDYLERAKHCGATEIHLKYDTCTKQRVREIHAAGFGSMLWMRGPIGMASDCADLYWDVGNEDSSMYMTLVQTGVQQMCINKPDVLLELRRQQREQREQQGSQGTMEILKKEFFESIPLRNETSISTEAS
jgi:glycerophosphoryl diester phosphodiesterase